jgi:molybdopterin molybdotransferase
VTWHSSKDVFESGGGWFLAGLGFAQVSVFEKPKVAVVVTGNELVTAGELLAYGKVYESNAVMLQSALYDGGFDKVSLYRVADDFVETQAVLGEAIAANDVVLVSGSISVGDYDFVGRA